MILLAVVVGYLLGVAPSVVPKIIEMIQNRNIKGEPEEANKEATEIFNEWLNGPQEEIKVNQEDIYNEYITGNVTKKGD